MSSGGVGKLYAQRRERQGLATSIVGHFDEVDESEACKVSQCILGILFAWGEEVMQVSKLVYGVLKWVVKNASQTDRENVIGALDGKEVCVERNAALQACRCELQEAIGVLSFRPKVILMLTTFSFSFLCSDWCG